MIRLAPRQCRAQAAATRVQKAQRSGHMVDDEKIEHWRDLLEGWFLRSGGGALILPDGWFGRSPEGIHRLTYLTVRPVWVVLELDDRLLLTIREPATVDHRDGELVIAGFASCVVDDKGYPRGRGHVRVYSGGEVRLVGSSEGSPRGLRGRLRRLSLVSRRRVRPGFRSSPYEGG